MLSRTVRADEKIFKKIFKKVLAATRDVVELKKTMACASLRWMAKPTFRYLESRYCGPHPNGRAR